jgi:hypothetical protein
MGLAHQGIGKSQLSVHAQALAGGVQSAQA